MLKFLILSRDHKCARTWISSVVFDPMFEGLIERSHGTSRTRFHSKYG